MNDFDNYPDELGNFIRHFRKARGLTLRGLEEKSGISYSQLSKIERGESIPLKDNLDKIIEALGGISRTGCIIWPTICLILSTSRP